MSRSTHRPGRQQAGRPLSRRTRAVALAVVAVLAATLAGLAGPTSAAAAAGPLPSKTTVTVSASTVTTGTPVTVTVKVSVLGTGLLITPSGRASILVANSDGSTLGSTVTLSTACLLAACSASTTFASLPPGTSNVYVDYEGDTLAASSGATTTITVNGASATAPTLSATSQVGSIKLEWTPGTTSAPPTGYNLYRSTSAAGPFAPLVSGLPSGGYLDTTVVVGTTYYYQATTSSGPVESPRSTTASAAATQVSGQPGSSATVTCSPGTTCTTGLVSASYPIGGCGGPVDCFYASTTARLDTESSTGTHVATAAVGGSNLTGCTNPVAVGLSVTFNDTSSDAYKSLLYRLGSPEASQLWSYHNDHPSDGLLCMGLGFPWTNTTGQPATWSPADGLYEGFLKECPSPGHQANPCYRLQATSSEGYVTQLDVTVELPPGDGKISGGR